MFDFSHGHYLSDNPAYPGIFHVFDAWKGDDGKAPSQRSLSMADGAGRPLLVGENSSRSLSIPDASNLVKQNSLRVSKSKEKRKSILDELLKEKEMYKSATGSSAVKSDEPMAISVESPASTEGFGSAGSGIQRRPNIVGRKVTEALRRTSMFDNLGLKKNMSQFIDDVRFLRLVNGNL